MTEQPTNRKKQIRKAYKAMPSTHAQLATIVFKTKIHHQPEYLDNLLLEYKQPRVLRSSADEFLAVPRTRTVLATRGFLCSCSKTVEHKCLGPFHPYQLFGLFSLKNTIMFLVKITNLSFLCFIIMSIELTCRISNR